MNCCYKIYIINIPKDVPSEFLDSEGYLMLDTIGGLTHTSNAEERSDINKLKGNSIKQISLPNTPKNDYILSHFKWLSLETDNYNGIDVLVIDDGIPLTEDILEISQYNDSGYTGLIRMSNQFWKDKAQELKLNDVILGEYTFSRENIMNDMERFRYIDSQSPVYFPHIDYGWFPEGYYPYRRLRPLFSPLALLRAIFCQLGYDFKSPILETNYFRDMWLYLLDPAFGDYSEKGSGGLGVKYHNDNQYTHVSDSSTIYLSTPIVDYDVLNSYDDSLSRFDPSHHKGTGSYKVKIVADINSVVGGEGGFLIRHMRRNEYATGVLWDEVDSESITFADGSHPGQIEFIYDVLDFRSNNGEVDRIYLMFYQGEFGNEYTMVVDSLEVTITPSDSIISLGDTIELGTLLRKDPAIDFITGIVTALGIKLVTDEATKTVTMYHTTNKMMPTGEVPLSFYEKKTTELDVSCDSKQITFPDKVSTKFVMSFKESTDGYITYHELDKGDGLFSRVIGTGDKKVVANLYFEPTAMRVFLGGDAKKSNSPTIPIMVDSEPDVHGNFFGDSFAIQPRMVMGYGNVYQGTNEHQIRIHSELIAPLADSEIDICFATQEWRNGTINGGDIVKKNLSYDFYINDLFDLLLHNLILNQYNGVTIGYKKSLGVGDFFKFNFRKVYMINDGVGRYTGVINSIVSHDRCEGDSSNIVVHKFDKKDNCGECSLPCDCLMTTCYAQTDYNNLPDYDDWSSGVITSFVLNGVEQLSGQVEVYGTPNNPLNTIAVVDDNGGNTYIADYITNLVDGLNSLGIDMITFGYGGYSTDGTGEQLMTMTYPACWDFIIHHTICGFVWRITPQSSEVYRSWDDTWDTWSYNGDFGYIVGRPPCETFNPTEVAEGCVNDPHVFLQHKTQWYVPDAGNILYLKIAPYGFVSNVDTDVLSYRRPQVGAAWTTIVGTSLDICTSSAYTTMGYEITSSTETEVYVKLTNVGRCDNGGALDQFAIIGANGNIIDLNQNASNTIVLSSSFMSAFGGSLDFIAKWDSPAGTATRIIHVEDTLAGNANYEDDLAFTKSNQSPTYDIDVKRETTYTDGCDSTTVTESI